MAENRIQVRRGGGTPTVDQLMPYELGFDYDTSSLYIQTKMNDVDVTDLTGTTWILNNTLVKPNSATVYAINFNIKSGEQYTNFAFRVREGLDYFDANNATVNSLRQTYWWGQKTSDQISTNVTYSINGEVGGGSFDELQFSPSDNRITSVQHVSETATSYATIWLNGFYYGYPIYFGNGTDVSNINLINWMKKTAWLGDFDAEYLSLEYGNSLSLYEFKNYNSRWTMSSPAYKTISITGGTDVTNNTLINWLKNNATMVGGTDRYKNIKLIEYIPEADGLYLPLSAGSNNPLTNILYINLSNDGTQAQSTGIHIQHNGVNRGTLYQYCYENGSTNPDFLALVGRNDSGSQVNGIRFFDSGSVVLFGGANTITLRPNGASSTSGQVNLATNGTLTVSGDIRRTAKTYSASQTASKSLSSGNTKICGITGIEAGVYLINAYVHMTMTGGGNAYINLYKATNNTSAICYDNHYVKAGSSYFTTTTWATFAASGNLSLYIEVTASCSVDNVVLSMIRIA